MFNLDVYAELASLRRAELLEEQRRAHLLFANQRRTGHRIGLWLLVLSSLALWLFYANAQAAQAQGARVCRDQGNLTICGDTFEDFKPDLGIDGYRIAGNLTISTRGGAPVLRVVDASDDIFASSNPQEVAQGRARFEHVASSNLSPYGHTDILFGDISFVNDPRQRSPFATGGFFDDSADGNSGSVVPGVFWVDTVNESVFAPVATTVPIYPREITDEAIVLYNPLYLQHLGLEAMYAEDATLQDHSIFGAEYSVKQGKFTVSVTIPKLRLFENAENKDLPVTLRITMDDKGNYTGAADGFKLRMAGMTGEAKGISVKPGEFEATSLEFSRADNPTLPNLDPSNPNLVFRLESLKYKDGHFAVGGVVGIKDWQLGNAMRLTKQSVGLFVDDVLKTTSIVISSTLTFPARSVATDGGQYPMRIEIGAKKVGEQFVPFGKGILRNPNRPSLNLGPIAFGLPETTTLRFDPSQNFFGVEAEKVTITWKGHLGGKSGVESTFRLGVNSQHQLIFLIHGGTLNLPEMRTGAMSVLLAGTMNNLNDTVTLKLKGTARLFLPGNSGVAPTAEVTITSGKAVCAKICGPTYQMRLSGFELKVAGFTLGLVNPRGTEDGGYAADAVTLKVPAGITSFGGQITGLKVMPNNDISITGGSFELPPLTIGKVSFVGVKGSFVKIAGGGYEFHGGGVMPLPGLDPSGGPQGKKIAVNLTIRTDGAGDFSGMGVRVIFSTGSPGIPIGGTGMELLTLSGEFSLNQNTAKIGVSLRVGSTARVGPLPVATGTAKAELQINPMMFTANGELSVLIFKVAEAQMGLGAGQGFNGGNGFNVSFTINQIIVHGDARLRVGPVTLSNGNRINAFTAEARMAVGLKRGQFGRLLPPRDIFLSEKSFKGGLFRYKNTTEKIGLMTTVGCCIFFDATVFVDLTDGIDVSFVNAKDYKLFDEAQVRAAVAAGEQGFAAQQVLASEVMGADFVGAASLDATATVLQETIPVEISQQSNALFGIAYPEGAPILRLQRPDGTILTEESVDNVTSGFLRNTATITQPHDVAFLLKDAQPGVYTMIIDNAPAEYEKVSYVLSQEPTLSDVTVTCGGEPVAGVTVTCNGATSGTTVNIGWSAADRDSITATVRVAYTAVLSDGVSIDGTNLTFITDTLPLGAGTATWDLSDVPTGLYKVVVGVEDGEHAPVETVAETLIAVTDGRAPIVPGGLQAQPMPGELLVTWTPNRERDVAGYEIGFGVVDPALPDDPGRFVYLRDMGHKEVEVPTGDLLDAKLWGLTDNQEVFVGIRAYDRSGNVSAWSPLLRAVPWALSPAAWTPAPNGTTGTATHIEVAFETVLITETLGSVIEVKAADGTVVPGTVELIPNLDGEIVGVRFLPSVLLSDGGEYTVTLRGGDGGVATRDGRRMAADYTWRFTATASLNRNLFLPLISK
jgi:hypothetical protein